MGDDRKSLLPNPQITSRGKANVKVTPVIDIQNGTVVHAIKGNRSRYKPLKSFLCDSADPLAVASAFKSCGFKELYVADLDAITGKSGNFAVLQRIAEQTGLELMVDAGVSDFEKAERLFRRKISKLIVGTETLPSLDFLAEMLKRYGCERVGVSLDLKKGKVLSKSEVLSSLNPLGLALKFQEMGVGELIVLDLARVGSGEGADLALLKQMVNRSGVRIDVGGGVRDTNDLLTLKELGVNGVLLATALHSGKISVEELRRLGFF
jgi:phosphoribosylformimino-5-aminoimidazole carboxamide ribotide isomerase